MVIQRHLPQPLCPSTRVLLPTTHPDLPRPFPPLLPRPPRAHTLGLSCCCSAPRNQRTQACTLLVVCAPSRYQVSGPRLSTCVRPSHSVSRSPGGGARRCFGSQEALLDPHPPSPPLQEGHAPGTQWTRLLPAVYTAPPSHTLGHSCPADGGDGSDILSQLRVLSPPQWADQAQEDAKQEGLLLTAHHWSQFHLELPNRKADKPVGRRPHSPCLMRSVGWNTGARGSCHRTPGWEDFSSPVSAGGRARE